MSNYGGNQVTPILVDGYDCTGAPLTDVQDSVEALTELGHGLGDSWQKSLYTNLRKFSLSMKGFYDDTAGSVRDAFNDTKNGLLRIINYGLQGNVVGGECIGFEGAGENSFKRLPSLGVLLKAEVGFASGGGHAEVGQILHVYQTETVAGDTKTTPADRLNDERVNTYPITAVSVANPSQLTSSVPHGYVTGDVVQLAGFTTTPTINGQQTVTVVDATHFTIPVNVTVVTVGVGTASQLDSDNGGAAYLQLSALTLGGFTNFAPLALHSTDNVTYVTLATFNPATVAPQAQRVSVSAGTKVRRYLATSWTYGGAGGGQSAKFFIGFARAR